MTRPPKNPPILDQSFSTPLGATHIPHREIIRVPTASSNDACATCLNQSVDRLGPGDCMLCGTLSRPEGQHMTHPLTHPARGAFSAASRPGPPPVERPAPLREAVYDALGEMIITAELQPGQHLVENDLAAQLGVSRQPVREALQRMQTEGWVDLRPALGAFVHIPTEDEADQLLAARTLLETESARLAAEHATPEQVQALGGLH